jgi:hypothetical protein
MNSFYAIVIREANSMRGDQSQLVRDVAMEHFVKPAKARGLKEVVIPVKQLRDLLVPVGFPPRNIPQICSALEANAFRHANQFESMSVEGPASKRSTTVVFHFLFRDSARDQVSAQPAPDPKSDETSEEWAERLTGKLRGLLKEELAAYGGGEAFIKWMRSEEENEA